MRRFIIGLTLTACALVAVSACGGGSNRSSAGSSTAKTVVNASSGGSSTTVDATKGWDTAALGVAQQLAQKITASHNTCTEYSAWNHDALANDMKHSELPVPAAVSQCYGDAREDLTFDVFTDATHKKDFVTAKVALLCNAAKRQNMTKGFEWPYLDGGTWILEPDQYATATKLAPILSGVAKKGTC